MRYSVSNQDGSSHLADDHRGLGAAVAACLAAVVASRAGNK
jgi:hypothetical protein